MPVHVPSPVLVPLPDRVPLPVHVLRQVGETVVAQVQQAQAAHPQGTDGDGHEPVLRNVQVNQLLQAAELPATSSTR